MWVGNLYLLVINLPLIGMWGEAAAGCPTSSSTGDPGFCCIGAYSVNNNVFDVYSTALFAVAGYMFNKLRMEPAPLLIGFVPAR